ncbi:MAG: divalent-cation tolerance protein CutA [Alphaproteobacteria bacterium]|nr:divalent-cation tolerance protein CutA [Alphaproteobacteria bacterium]
MQTILLYITAKNKQEAQSIAQTLLAEKLIACANILPEVTSLFQWQGTMQEDSEVIMLAKTTKQNTSCCIERITALHSYDCPCILAFAPEGGHEPFIKWIFSQVRD